MSQRFSPFTPYGAGLILAAVLAGYTGCKKEEPPPPMPSAAPAPTPTPTEPLTLVPEAPVADAGAEVPDAGHHTGGGVASSLAKCCAELAKNAALAPSPNKEYLQAAAQACSMAVGAGASNASVLAAVQGALRGAGVPATCK